MSSTRQKLEGKYDVLLKDGRVAEVAAHGKLRGKADENFNARGLIVAPGFIDAHFICASLVSPTKRPLPAAPWPLLPEALPPSAPCPIPARSMTRKRSPAGCWILRVALT